VPLPFLLINRERHRFLPLFDPCLKLDPFLFKLYLLLIAVIVHPLKPPSFKRYKYKPLILLPSLQLLLVLSQLSVILSFGQVLFLDFEHVLLLDVMLLHLELRHFLPFEVEQRISVRVKELDRLLLYRLVDHGHLFSWVYWSRLGVRPLLHLLKAQVILSVRRRIL
jgi:hypothetical protein